MGHPSSPQKTHSDYILKGMFFLQEIVTSTQKLVSHSEVRCVMP